MQIKKILSAFTAAFVLASTAYSNIYSAEIYSKDGNRIKANAVVHTQFGYVDQDNLTDSEKKVSTHVDNYALYNEAAFSIQFDKDLGDDTNVGGMLIVVPTAKRKGGIKYNGTHIYHKFSWGKIEVGSRVSAASQLSKSGYSVVTSGVGNWFRYIKEKTEFLQQGTSYNPSFYTSSDLVLDGSLSTAESLISSEPSRKVTYLTPKMNFSEDIAMQIGVSFTPDSSNTGAGSFSSQGSGNIKKTFKEGDITHDVIIDQSVKNMFSYGVNLDFHLGDGVDAKLTFVGEHGTAVGKINIKSGDETVDELELSNLNTWSIGGVVNVGNAAFAGSYSDWSDSLTNAKYHKRGRKTSSFTLGASYKWDQFKISVAGFNGSKFNNDATSISGGISYNIVPGFTTYMAFANVKLKAAPEYYISNALKDRTTSSNIFILGTSWSM